MLLCASAPEKRHIRAFGRVVLGSHRAGGMSLYKRESEEGTRVHQRSGRGRGITLDALGEVLVRAAVLRLVLQVLADIGNYALRLMKESE